MTRVSAKDTPEVRRKQVDEFNEKRLALFAKLQELLLSTTKSNEATDMTAVTITAGKPQAPQQTKEEIELLDKNINFERSEDKKIILPEDMTFAQAAAWCLRKEKQEEEKIAIYEEIIAYPFDGAHALAKALSAIYGWTNLVPTPGFFRDNPPTMIGLEVGPGEQVQVPWGRITIPGIDGFLQTEFTVKNKRMIFLLQGEVKQKHKGDIAKVANLTRAILAKESIYKGKAIRVRFEEDPEQFDPRDCPKFMDVSGVKPDELIFPQGVKDLIDVNIFTPIEHTAACREQRIPLKRGILLEGPYGTGKTLAADVTAQKAVNNGWTFIYLEKVEQFQQAYYFAQQYQPAVIFAEDIDSILDGERDEGMNDVLNTIDGVDTKRAEVMVVLTTNFVEKIDKAMIRPGRLDAVITVKPPDADAVRRLVYLYARGLLAHDEDIAKACHLLAGQIPAVVREVVERSKLAAVRRLQPGGKLALKGDDLAIAADGMMQHLEMMKPVPADERSDNEKAADRLGPYIASLASSLKSGAVGKTNGQGAVA